MTRVPTRSRRSSSSRPSGTRSGCELVGTLVDRIKAGEIGAPVSELIGFRLTSVEPGKAVFELDAGPQHANPMGTLHGGVLCDVADAAMGTAHAPTLGAGDTFPQPVPPSNPPP